MKSKGSRPSAGTVAPAVPSQPRLWSEAATEARVHSRDAFKVPADAVSVHTDPSILAESPRASDGLFELVGPIARRALELGLGAREPSFHVFVAAEPEVMIEDDIVRYAQRLAASRPSPPDVVYVHDFDHPAAPKPLILPAGVGPLLVDAMKQVIEKLRHEMPS
ncbi:MAG TPA: Lon-like protease helical domain-containing protein, partial [Polyangiaceae bacterium]